MESKTVVVDNIRSNDINTCAKVGPCLVSNDNDDSSKEDAAASAVKRRSSPRRRKLDFSSKSEVDQNSSSFPWILYPSKVDKRDHRVQQVKTVTLREGVLDGTSSELRQRISELTSSSPIRTCGSRVFVEAMHIKRVCEALETSFGYRE